jgi:transposase
LALSKLTAEQQADVQEALDADDVRGEAIARLLKRIFSIDISARTVNRHRQNVCQCGRVLR